MKHPILFSTCAVVVSIVAAAAGQDAAPRSAWDGVYTTEQAGRGARLADQHCIACHGDRLTGGELAPALTGEVFTATWDGVMLSDLFDRIRTTMPLDNPGTLSRQQSVELLAYVLSIGKFPAGDAPLVTDAGVLGQIKFQSIRPQR